MRFVVFELLITI